MSEFILKTTVLLSQFEYEDGTLNVQGEIRRNAETSEVERVAGSVSIKEETQVHVGSFSGSMRGNEMKYSLSEMTRLNADIVWSAIAAIEQQIITPQPDPDDSQSDGDDADATPSDSEQ